MRTQHPDMDSSHYDGDVQHYQQSYAEVNEMSGDAVEELTLSNIQLNAIWYTSTSEPVNVKIQFDVATESLVMLTQSDDRQILLGITSITDVFMGRQHPTWQQHHRFS